MSEGVRPGLKGVKLPYAPKKGAAKHGDGKKLPTPPPRPNRGSGAGARPVPPPPRPPKKAARSLPKKVARSSPKKSAPRPSPKKAVSPARNRSSGVITQPPSAVPAAAVRSSERASSGGFSGAEARSLRERVQSLEEVQALLEKRAQHAETAFDSVSQLLEKMLLRGFQPVKEWQQRAEALSKNVVASSALLDNVLHKWSTQAAAQRDAMAATRLKLARSEYLTKVLVLLIQKEGTPEQKAALMQAAKASAQEAAKVVATEQPDPHQDLAETTTQEVQALTQKWSQMANLGDLEDFEESDGGVLAGKAEAQLAKLRKQAATHREACDAKLGTLRGAKDKGKKKWRSTKKEGERASKVVDKADSKADVKAEPSAKDTAVASMVTGDFVDLIAVTLIGGGDIMPPTNSDALHDVACYVRIGPSRRMTDYDAAPAPEWGLVTHFSQVPDDADVDLELRVRHSKDQPKGNILQSFSRSFANLKGNGALATAVVPLATLLQSGEEAIKVQFEAGGRSCGFVEVKVDKVRMARAQWIQKRCLAPNQPLCDGISPMRDGWNRLGEFIQTTQERVNRMLACAQEGGAPSNQVPPVDGQALVGAVIEWADRGGHDEEDPVRQEAEQAIPNVYRIAQMVRDGYAPIPVWKSERQGQTLLHLLTIAGDVALVKMLYICVDAVRQCVDLGGHRGRDAYSQLEPSQRRFRASIPDDYGMTPIHYAILLDRKEILQALWDLDNFLCPPLRERPLLQTVIHLGNTDILRTMVRGGADVDEKDSLGSTPLAYACMKGDLKVVKTLVDLSAFVAAEDVNGTQPLLHTVLEGHWDVSRYLLKNGADMNASNNAGVCPVWECLFKESVLAFELVSRPEVDLGISLGPHKCTLLQQLLAYGEIGRVSDMLKRLLDLGIDPTDYNGERKTAMFHAVAYAHLDVVAILLQAGASVNARDAVDNTPLHFATCVEMVELLLSHGAKVSARNAMGYTPLHVARALGLEEVAATLRGHGASKSIGNKHGNSPSQVAEWAAEHEDTASTWQLRLPFTIGDASYAEMGGIFVTDEAVAGNATAQISSAKQGFRNKLRRLRGK